MDRASYLTKVESLATPPQKHWKSVVVEFKSKSDTFAAEADLRNML